MKKQIKDSVLYSGSFPLFQEMTAIQIAIHFSNLTQSNKTKEMINALLFALSSKEALQLALASKRADALGFRCAQLVAYYGSSTIAQYISDVYGEGDTPISQVDTMQNISCETR